MTQKVGLIGLGNAGLALATPVARKFTVIAYDREESRCKLARAAGIEVAPNARAVAEGCDVLMLCLPNPAISRTVLNEMGTAALERKLIMENSTVGPEDIEAMLSITAPAKARVMEAARRRVGALPFRSEAGARRSRGWTCERESPLSSAPRPRV